MEAAEHFVGGGYYGCVADDFPQKPPEQMQFTVDDLLNFSNEDSAMIGDGFCDNAVANSAESSSFNSCNSSLSGGDSYFSNSLGSRNLGDASFSADLCVPVISLVSGKRIFTLRHSLKHLVVALSVRILINLIRVNMGLICPLSCISIKYSFYL